MLAMLYKKANETNFNYSVMTVQDKGNSDTLNHVIKLASGQYRVMGIDVEEDSVMRSGQPAIVDDVEVTGKQGIG